MPYDKAHTFDFIEELRKEQTYKLLFPDKKEGIVIALLYEKLQQNGYENDQFSAQDIHNLFKLVDDYNPQENNKYQYERNVEKIRNLQRFFLSYDDATQLYSFQGYGIQFCQIAEKTLEGTCNPTEIEIICKKLRKELDGALNNDKDLLNWFTYDFAPFKAKLKEQIDFLYIQITDSVKKLRNDTTSKGQNSLDLLITVNNDLSEIQQKNKDLRAAYNETDEITNILMQLDSDHPKVLTNIQETARFFRSIRSRLNASDSKLGRIQPRIKQLFSSLNKPIFNAKTERFIDFLLQHSTVERQYNDKVIVMPEMVKSFEMHSLKSRLMLLNNERSLFPLKPKERARYERNKQVEKKNQEFLDKSIENFKIIGKWVDGFWQELNIQGTLDASLSFMKVLEEEKDFTIATKVYFSLLEKAHSNNNFNVSIEKQNQIKDKTTKISVWKTTMTKF